MQASISFNQSHKSSLSHNNREHKSGNPDIDEARSDLNIYFVREDLQEVYQELFQEAVDSYNEKQSRNDRKIEDYYMKIHNDSKTHEQRELVVAIGEGKDSESFRSGKREALIKYAEEFQERNPNLRVYNMVLHDDEANPHLHINYVPHFESKRGLTKRVGMDKALQQQGVEGKGTQLIGNWRAIETGRIEELAKEHIPGFERANVGSHKYMKVQEYKDYAETLNTVKLEVENNKADLEFIESFKEAEKAKLSVVERQLHEKENELQRSVAKLDQLKSEVAKIEAPMIELESIKETKLLKNKVLLDKTDYDLLKDLAKKSLDENKSGLELERENKVLRSKVVEHEKNESEYLRRINVLTDQRDKHRTKSNELEKENNKLSLERNMFKKLYEIVKKWVKDRGHNLAFGNLEKQVEREEKQRQQLVQERTMEMDR